MSDNKNVKARPVVTEHPSSLKHSNSNQDVNGGYWASISHHRPVTLSIFLSLALISGIAFYLYETNFSLQKIELIETSMVITGATIPFVIFWLLCLVLIRINHLEENKRALESGLYQLLNPLEITQERINKVVENLKKEITKVEAVEETNKALEKNAEKYQQMINAIQLSSQSLAANANAIENRMKRINSEKFSDVSAKIMEKLQSESVDIINYLDGDIPRDLWDKYLTGDKNIFVRKIKKHIGKKTASDIRAYYLENRKFRKNTDSFVQIFEELLDTFNESTETIYSETLITSDIGKVYFALAEAIGRLKS